EMQKGVAVAGQQRPSLRVRECLEAESVRELVLENGDQIDVRPVVVVESEIKPRAGQTSDVSEIAVEARSNVRSAEPARHQGIRPVELARQRGAVQGAGKQRAREVGKNEGCAGRTERGR